MERRLPFLFFISSLAVLCWGLPKTGCSRQGFPNLQNEFREWTARTTNAYRTEFSWRLVRSGVCPVSFTATPVSNDNMGSSEKHFIKK